MKPTQKQIDKFLSKADENQLRNIMKYAKDKEVRDKAAKLYQWVKAEEYQLKDIMEFAKDKEVRDRAKKYLENFKFFDMMEYLTK